MTTTIPNEFMDRLTAKAAKDAADAANSQVENFEPVADRVLVLRLSGPEELKSKGGLVIPEQAREKPLEATVLRVGPGKITDNGVRHMIAVNVGDTILIGKYSGTDVTLDGRELLILNESEIFGVIRRADRRA